MRLAVWNLAVYSAQLAILVCAAALSIRLLPVRVPALMLRYWQLCLAAAFILPLVQPWSPAAAPTSLVASMSEQSALNTSARAVTIDWWSVAAAIVVLGIACRLAMLMIGVLRLRGIVSRATAIAVDAPGADILLSTEIDSPATIGWRRPKILLPPRALDLSQPAQHAIVAHELAHIERGDWLATVAEELWCAVLWFHPGARVLASRLSLAREMVVDDITIRRTRNRRAYAEALLAFADPQQHIVGATPLIGRRTLRQRISLIAEEVAMSRRRALSHVIASALLVAPVLTVAVALLPLSSPVYAQEVMKPGNGVTLPEVVQEVKPEYTREAMDQKIQGSVYLRVVVTASGDVGEVAVSRSLDTEYGLDAQAVGAAKMWKFRPGMKNGKPVAVEVELEMRFTLK